MSEHNELGRKGEEIALEYLANKGFKILHKNWRYKKLEIDIIAGKDEYLVIIEVKTRSNDYFERPQDAITLKKQKFLFNATEAYVELFDIDLEIRFDIVSILITDKKTDIEHIEDAFRPGW